MTTKSKLDIDGAHWSMLQTWKKEAVDFEEIKDIERFDFSEYTSANIMDLEDGVAKYHESLIEMINSESFKPCIIEKLFDNDDADFHIMGDL